MFWIPTNNRVECSAWAQFANDWQLENKLTISNSIWIFLFQTHRI
jgi:hypothetical protein